LVTVSTKLLKISNIRDSYFADLKREGNLWVNFNEKMMKEKLKEKIKFLLVKDIKGDKE
jgi:hypothetical protein